MKKALKRILAVLLVLIIAAGVIAYIQLHSPEFALYQTVKDMQKSGHEGLQKHLQNGVYYERCGMIAGEELCLPAQAPE